MYGMHIWETMEQVEQSNRNGTWITLLWTYIMGTYINQVSMEQRCVGMSIINMIEHKAYGANFMVIDKV